MRLERYVKYAAASVWFGVALLVADRCDHDRWAPSVEHHVRTADPPRSRVETCEPERWVRVPTVCYQFQCAPEEP